MMTDIAEDSIEIRKQLIKNAIEIYNNLRSHLSNSMLRPSQMHQQKKLKKRQGSNLKLLPCIYINPVTIIQDVTPCNYGTTFTSIQTTS